MEGKKQKALSKKKFEGQYKHLEISFEYSTIGNEIFAYNMHGVVDKVFPEIQENIVYVVLENSVEDDAQSFGQKEKYIGQKGKCMVAINLKTGKVSWLRKQRLIELCRCYAYCGRWKNRW